jgi:ATP-dependent exoDNAse (exonuclease V) alpha subunit
MVDLRQGLTHDYSHRGGVLHTEILLPENAPDWMHNRSDLWNAVEAIEKRKDARLTREVVLSLPHELTPGGRRELVRAFAQDQFVNRGMVADIAIHAPGAEGDERNHHAHIMLTTRSIEGDGFGGKDRSWNDKALLETWREAWGHHTNRTLEREGINARVDHRSLEARHTEQVRLREAALARGDAQAAREHEIGAVSFDREPLPHIGFKAWAMERRGIQTAIGATMREAKERLDQVRDMVRDLRAGMASVMERSGVSQALERLRGVSAERDGLSAEKAGGVAGAMERLREAQRGEAGPDMSRENIAAAATARERREQQEVEAAQERARTVEVQREHERVQALEKAKVAERDDYGHSL